MKKQNKIRHHYVPVGLSKNFCLEEKRLYLYDIQESKMLSSAPRDVFLQKNLHSIVTNDGSVDHNMVEDEFMCLEGNSLKVVNEILSGAEMTDERKDWLAVLVALQKLRTPLYRKGIEAIINEQYIAVAKVLDARGDFPQVPEALKPYGSSMSELLENGTIVPQITMPQVTMGGLCAIPVVHALLVKMNWCLLESSRDNYFILSDHPCAILDPDLRYHGMGLGLIQKNIEITMPIGKNHCLLASWKKIPQRIKLSKSQVSNINKRSAVFGERFFVHPLETKKVLNFLLPYKDCSFENRFLRVSSENGGQMVVARSCVGETGNIRFYEAIRPLF